MSTPVHATPFPTRKDTLLAWLVAALHLLVSFGCFLVLGFDIDSFYPLFSLWQLAPMASLRDDLLGVLAVLHMQPPAFNVLVALLIELFGAESASTGLYLLHMVLGSCMCVMVHGTVLTLGGSRVAAFLMAFLLAVHPALLLYEAFPIYDLLTTFLLTTCVWLAARHRRATAGNGNLYALLGMLVLLMLTRSMFHLLLFLPVGVLLVCAGRPPRRLAVALVLAALLPGAWYTKNLVQFGFFGSSSWFGLNFSKVALSRVSPRELRQLRDEGRVAPLVADVPLFDPLITEPLYTRYGYQQVGDSPELNAVNGNNINLIAVSRDYARSSFQVVREYPGRVALTVVENYWSWSVPSTHGASLEKNSALLGGYGELFAAWVQGGWLASFSARVFGQPYLLSYHHVLQPLVLIACVVWFIRRARARGQGWASWREELGEQAPLALIWLFITYSIVTSCLFETGENFRFAFYVEPMWLCLLAILAARALTASRRAAARR